VSFDATIHAAGRDWPVRIVRHHAARHYRLVLDPVRRALRLTVPPGARPAAALRWAAGQDIWIAGQAAKLGDERIVTAGGIVPVAGTPLTILWERRAPRTPMIDGAALRVGGDEAGVGRRVERWLKAEARALLSQESHDYAEQIGRRVQSVSVGDPRARWGSCSADGKLRYSWRLIMAPPHVRRATVAHEVAHLVHMHHGPAFHALVDNLFEGDVSTARAWLRREGRGLHLYRFA
jgi:predicted metal-dependent hydrolase